MTDTTAIEDRAAVAFAQAVAARRRELAVEAERRAVQEAAIDGARESYYAGGTFVAPSEELTPTGQDWPELVDDWVARFEDVVAQIRHRIAKNSPTAGQLREYREAVDEEGMALSWLHHTRPDVIPAGVWQHANDLYVETLTLIEGAKTT